MYTIGAFWTASRRCAIAAAFFAIAVSPYYAVAGNIFDDDWSPPPAKPGPAASPTPSPEVKDPVHPTDPTPPVVVSPPVTPTVERLVPIPTPQEQAKVRALFKDVYSRQLADQSARGKLALAHQLIGDAAKVTDAPTDRFVMLAGARHAAVDAADVDFAIRADDQLCKSFAVDAESSRLELLTHLSKAARTPASCSALVTAALQQSDDASARGQYVVAEQFAVVAVTASKGSDQATQRTEASSREANARAIAADYANLENALALLRKNPADADANLAAGRFYCLEVNQWSKGLTFLAAGSDAKMSAAANADIQGADALSIADQWRALAEKENATGKQNIRSRAAKWYQDAASTLTGLAKLKAEKELAAMGLDPARPSSPPTLSSEATAPDNSPALPETPRAAAAIAKYNTAAAAAKATFDRATSTAQKQLVSEFEIAKKKALSEPNLKEAERIYTWEKLLESKSPKSLGVIDLKSQIIALHKLTYKYATFGSHEMEFLPDGRIGDGWGSLEKRWEVVERPRGAVIVITGDAGPCDFIRKDDGTFAGTWPDNKGYGVLTLGPAKPDSAVKGNDPSADRPKSPAALTAMKSFEAAIEKARAARTKAMAVPLKVLISELNAAEKEAMKAQNIDEAKRIDDWRKYAESNASDEKTNEIKK